MKTSGQKGLKETVFSGNMDARQSAGGASGGMMSSNIPNMNKQKKAKLVLEANPMLGGAKKCKEIWNAIRKADFRNEGILNEANINLVFQKNQDIIQDLLRVKTAGEFVELFDQDQDGFLNEDEQILIFSLIKEKMQLLAEELCNIHEYQLYKDLMKEVRQLENDIVDYQNELRTNIQTKQLSEYIQIGDEKLREFYDKWEKIFADFQNESLRKVEELNGMFLRTSQAQNSQMDVMNMKLDRAVEAVKIKPSAKLKEMQNNEKLLAINERIEEAMNYRKELKDLEVQEQLRVEKLRNENQENQRKKLLAQQKKEMMQLEAKIETGRHNLKIKMDKELNVLQKEINLHVNDIKRIQGLMSRLAMKKGEINDELRRDKERARKTMKQLKNTKKIEGVSPDRTSLGMTSTVPGFSDESPINLLLFSNLRKQGTGTQTGFGNTITSNNSNYSSVILPLKNIMKTSQFTRFDIATENEQEKKPVNEQEEHKKTNAGLQTKIKVLLDQRKPPTETLPSLCDMYDDDLNPLKP